MNQERPASRGFTLIELLVVIAIIGILSAVVLASLSMARDRAKLAAARSFMAHTRSVLADNATHSWEFKECSGTTVTDSGIEPVDGTFSGSLSWSTDTPTGVGCSVNFSGSGRIIIPGTPLPAGAYTKAAWVKIAPAQCVATGNVISATTNNGAVFYVPSCQMRGGHNGAWNVAMDSTSIGDGNWHAIAISYNPAVDGGTLRLYRDGEMVKSVPNIPVQAGREIEIGSHAGGNNFRGFMANPQVWGEALF